MGGGTGTRKATLSLGPLICLASTLSWALGLRGEDSPSRGSKAWSVRTAGSRPPFRIHTRGVTLHGPERWAWCYCLPKETGENLAGSERGLPKHRICLRSPWTRGSSSDMCSPENILCSLDFWPFHVPLLVLRLPSSPVPNPLSRSCDLQGSMLVLRTLSWGGGGNQLRGARCPHTSPLHAVAGLP